MVGSGWTSFDDVGWIPGTVPALLMLLQLRSERAWILSELKLQELVSDLGLSY